MSAKKKGKQAKAVAGGKPAGRPSAGGSGSAAVSADATPTVVTWAVPVAVAIVWITLVFGASFGSVVPWTVGLLGGVALAGIAAWRGVVPGRPTLIALGVCAAAVAVLFVAAFASPDPAVSVFGFMTGRLGATMSLAALAWLVAATMLGSRDGLSRTAAVVAIAAGAAGLVAIAQTAGVVKTLVEWSAEPAAFFTGSQALGQALVFGLGAAGVWWLGARRDWERWTALGLGAVTAVALAVSQARGAWVGVVVALVALPLLVGMTAKPWRRAWTWASGALLALGALAMAGLFAVSLGDPAGQTFRTVDSVLTDRATIWRSALTQGVQHTALGRGPMQFSAYTSWLVGQDGYPAGPLTFDPHNLVLWWWVSAGVVGVAVVLAGFAAVLLALRERLRGDEGLTPRVAAVAALAGWTATTMFTWPEPAVMLAAAAMLGLVLARPADRRGATKPALELGGGRPTWVVAAAGALAAACAIALVLSVPRITAEVRVLGVAATDLEGRVSALADGVATTGDPEMRAQYLGVLLDRRDQAGQGGSAVEKEIAAAADAALPQAGAHAGLAYAVFDASLAIAKADAQAPARIEQTLAAGSKADPTSGIWDALAARAAIDLGKPADAGALLQQAAAKNPRQSLDEMTRLMGGR